MDYNPITAGKQRRTPPSRRHILGWMLAAWPCLSAALPRASAKSELDAAQPATRLAISESLLGDANVSDARAAMKVWIQQIARDLKVVMDPKLLASTQEIVERTRAGLLDAVAVNVIEYQQIADLLDSRQVICTAGAEGLERYVILIKQNSGIRALADLKGRRLTMLKAPKTCMAPPWLLTLLDEGHHGLPEQFFSSMMTDTKSTRVVLPVFFGQAEACLTTQRSFDTMCELNPQVGKDLKVLVASPGMVVDFYIFHKNYQSVYREQVIRAISSLHTTAAGRQLAMLFQFQELAIRDGGCLSPALGVLDRAERARKMGPGSRK